MFAVMYSTQAILPVLGRDFGVSPAQAGLTVSVVVLALAAGAWLWGPLSDRWGRKRTLVCASALVVAPTLAAALAPSFGALLACRALQGLCLPGLLTVGAPYVVEVFGPAFGGKAMGFYICALVGGGVLARVGVALATAAVGWRWALGALAALPAAGALLMARTLPPSRVAAPAGRLAALGAQARNRPLLQATAAGSALFFTFVAVFSFVTYRLEGAPFGWSPATTSLVFLLWGFGAVGPVAGTLADKVGWRRLVTACLGLAALAVLVSLPTQAISLVAALGLLAATMFAGVTAAQLGAATASDRDRGTATALYFSCYYATGALGGFLPGLAWEHGGWAGVAALALAALALAATAVALLR
jgi:YNFM family putative membrane transporter